MNADWLRYDAEAGLLWLTDRKGKEACYVRARQVAHGKWHLDVSYVGTAIRGEEWFLRSLPERVLVRRLAELSPVIGLPKPGATDTYFEFVRRDVA